AQVAAQTPPAPAPDSLRLLSGDYTAGDHTVLVTEVNGRLLVRSGMFSSPPLEGSRIRIGSGELWIGDTRYVKRDVASGTFKITPVRPVEELRREALAAVPPRQPDTLLAPDLVELRSLDPTIKYDIRYATTNNFMTAVFYSQPKA